MQSQRRLREELGGLERAGHGGGPEEDVAGEGRVAGSFVGVGEREQQLAAAHAFTRFDQVERLQRALAGAGGLFVRQELQRALGRAGRVIERLLDVAARRGATEVVRELGDVRLDPRAVGCFERLADAAVQPQAARGADLGVEG